MGAYDATSADQIDDRYINKGPAITKLMNKNAVEVEPAAESAMTSWIILLFSTDMLVALCSCIVVFTLVLAVFLRNRERVRRYVTGENRRVGSVYYVRPGIAPTQPTEI